MKSPFAVVPSVISSLLRDKLLFIFLNSLSYENENSTNLILLAIPLEFKKSYENFLILELEKSSCTYLFSFNNFQLLSHQDFDF